MFELNKVNKIYNNTFEDTIALHNINLKISKGEIIVILGPSGSGKSTLLNILSGIDRPTSGKVFFEDERLDKYKDEELTIYRRDNLGFIFQSYNLLANLTVKENIELGHNLSSDPIDIDEILETVDLTEQKNKYPKALSGGQMQRVSIARALVKNPKVLFCDEPTGALDEVTGKKILEALQDINDKYKTTIIIVTHNPSIADMANVVIKMNSGKISDIKRNTTIKKAKELRWA